MSTVEINISNWWLSVYIENVMNLDIQVGVIGAVLLIVAGIVLFKRTRNQIKLDRNVGLLGVVSPREPFRH